MTCQYKKSCALYSHNSLQCGLFSQRCKYHHEFEWYDKQVVTEHTDRIRMDEVRELELEFDGQLSLADAAKYLAMKMKQKHQERLGELGLDTQLTCQEVFDLFQENKDGGIE